MRGTVIWYGASGAGYHYTLFDLDAEFKVAPGVYIFARYKRPRWQALYIGETQNLRDCPVGPGHEKWAAAMEHGITHIHVRAVNAGQYSRWAEVRDLLARHLPVCNGPPR